MVAGILLASGGGSIRAPRVPVIAAQTVVGCLIARAITADILLAFVRDWPLFLGVVIVIVATSGLLGWASQTPAATAPPKKNPISSMPAFNPNKFATGSSHRRYGAMTSPLVQRPAVAMPENETEGGHGDIEGARRRQWKFV